MKLRFKRRQHYILLRRAVAALCILVISIHILINAGSARTPGNAGGAESFHHPESTTETTDNDHGEDDLCDLDVEAPMPLLRCGSPAKSFLALRELVIEAAGFDFLSKCGDLMRPKNARSDKSGVAFRSRHKAGEAFDYNQEDPRILLVREQNQGQTFWRTYLRCEGQDRSRCLKVKLATDNAGLVSAQVFDFTTAAERLGWYRIAARRGWGAEPSNKEFWHYQREESPAEPTITTNLEGPLSAISTAEFSRWESNTKTYR